ncbi:unnamed protein product [Moneuplotes crassus]|uniref:Uncharacterized protein n=1 Tax=Euplotes crassus TaxID=5936 RepID=A0AAD1U339_EUPCR|nr:unnamed protein product [Moneuplotes crassus]
MNNSFEFDENLSEEFLDENVSALKIKSSGNLDKNMSCSPFHPKLETSGRVKVEYAPVAMDVSKTFETKSRRLPFKKWRKDNKSHDWLNSKQKALNVCLRNIKKSHHRNQISCDAYSKRKVCAIHGSEGGVTVRDLMAPQSCPASFIS